MLRFVALVIPSLAVLVLSALPREAQAATLLQDSFTGTTIDPTQWTEIDPAGLGGTVGSVQQNGILTVANSWVASVWGSTALVSTSTFASGSLQISAKMTRGSDQLLGYGDTNFQSPGTSAFIIDLSGLVYALHWHNGVLVASNTNCGSYTAGATYTLATTGTGFDVYKNAGGGNVLLCSLTTSGHVSGKPVFLQSYGTASTFDDVLVTGPEPDPTPPGPPTGVTAAAGDTQATVSFSPPANNGWSAITTYTVTSSPGGFTATGSTSPITVTGLTNGVVYTLTVTATNAAGTSSGSSASNAVTPAVPTAPQPPTGVTATAGNAQATVRFSAPTNSGGAAITFYTVTSSPGGITATGATSPLTVTGLTNGVPYTFTVTASNAVGASTGSAASSAVTPMVPQVLFQDAFTGTTIDSSQWNVIDPAGTNIVQNGTLSVSHSYSGGAWGQTALASKATFRRSGLAISARLTRSSALLLGYGDYNFQSVGTQAYVLDLYGSSLVLLHFHNGSTVASKYCESYTAGATYTLATTGTGFDVYKNTGSGPVLQCGLTTPATMTDKPLFLQEEIGPGFVDDILVVGSLGVPNAPSGVTATAGNAQATVSFSAPTNDGGSAITFYTVTSSPGGFTATGATSPITVTGLTNGVPYTFTVTASNAVGTSTGSAASSAVTPNVPVTPDQVTGLVATGTNQQVLLGWEAPEDHGFTVTDYLLEYRTGGAGSWTTVADGVSTAVKAIVRGLVNSENYDFRVSAVNSVGTGTASTVVMASPRAITQLAFVINGESNSGGIGQNSDATADELAPRSAVQIMNLTSGLFDFEDLDIGANNLRDHAGLEGYYANSHGFELYLANAVEGHALPGFEQVYLVKTGQGGSTISQWNVGGTYWTKFLQRTAAAKAQLDDPTWVVWFSLGINDQIAGTPTSTFKANLIAHLQRIQADLPGAVIIMTGFEAMGYTAYTAALREVAAVEPNVFIIDTTAAALRDGNHWSYAGLKTVGTRLVETSREVLGLIYPEAPGNPQASAGDNHMILSWQPPQADGGAPVTDYAVEYKRHSESSYATWVDGVSTGTSATVNGLVAGTLYDFRITAINAQGSGASVLLSATTTGTGVSLLPTTVSLASSRNPSSEGEALTLTAILTPSAATGTVLFQDGLLALGSALIGQGSGSLTLSLLSVGTHALTAVYAGNSTYSGSVSNTVTQVVQAASNSSASSSSPRSPATGVARGGGRARSGLSMVHPARTGHASVAVGSHAPSATELTFELPMLLQKMRDRLAARIERRILAQPSVAALLRRILERLNARIAARRP
ncbi:hypothetical protein GC163_08395 [bacterium]|nr:hypothetical protein [bacterium]